MQHHRRNRWRTALGVGVLAMTAVGGGPPPVAEAELLGGETFFQSTDITIPNVGAANPYPSTNTVSGLTGRVARVTVRIDISPHSFPDNLDILLEGPEGQTVLLMSDAGGGVNTPLAFLHFSDEARGPLPGDGPLVSGLFRPTNFEAGVDAFPAPAPAGPYSIRLSTFRGTNPNGNWKL